MKGRVNFRGQILQISSREISGLSTLYKSI